MKILVTLLVALAALIDLGMTFNIGGLQARPQTRRGFGSFLSGAFSRQSRTGAVPRVSVAENARKLDQFLMKTFSATSGGGIRSHIQTMSGGTFSKVGGRGRPSVQQQSEDMYDVLLVLDSSGSIGSDEFLKAKQFMTDIVGLLPATISQDNTRIAAISFSDAAKLKTEFNFLTHTNKNAVIQAVNSIPYQNGGSTHTTAALQRAKQILETSGRPGAQKALFIATDGRSNGGGNPAIPANQMKNSDRTDVKIVVIAVSHNVNNNEVRAIASSPPEDHVYYVNSFTEATSVTHQVRQKMMSRNLPVFRRS